MPRVKTNKPVIKKLKISKANKEAIEALDLHLPEDAFSFTGIVIDETTNVAKAIKEAVTEAVMEVLAEHDTISKLEANKIENVQEAVDIWVKSISSTVLPITAQSEARRRVLVREYPELAGVFNPSTEETDEEEEESLDL